MSKPDISLLISSLAAEILKSSEQGCPVAPSDKEQATQMAKFAMRRRRNQQRRKLSHSRCATDLSKALARDLHKNDMKLVGPLMRDYEWLSEKLMQIFLAD